MEISFYFLLMIPVLAGDLPNGARRVDSCPEPYNLTAWVIASKNLRCTAEYRSGYQDDIEKLLFYHCLPSTFINELIEFCAPLAAIGRGHCPIYNYGKGATVATSRNCANYTKGCPNPRPSPYYSHSFYKYPECWNINRILSCFVEEPNCPPEKNGFDLPTTAEMRSSTQNFDIPTTSEMRSSTQNWMPILTLSIVCCFICGFIGFVVWYCLKNKHGNEKGSTNETEMLLGYKDEFENLRRDMEAMKVDNQSLKATNADLKQRILETEKSADAIEKIRHEMEALKVDNQSLKATNVDLKQRILATEKSADECAKVTREMGALKLDNQSLKEEEGAGENSPQLANKELATFRHNDFLLELSNAMKKDACIRIINALKDVMRNSSGFDENQDPMTLLKHIDEKYSSISRDVTYLQRIFWILEQWTLFDICLKYAKSRRKYVIFFEIKTENDNSKCIVYFPENSTKTGEEMEKTRESLAEFLELDVSISQVPTSVTKTVDYIQDIDVSKENQRIEFHMKGYHSKTEIDDLSKWIEEIIKLNPYKIHLVEQTEIPNVAIYLVKIKDAEAIKKYLLTDDGQIAASRKKVAKFIYNQVDIPIEQAVNGEKFVHVKVRQKEKKIGNVQENIKNATSIIVAKAGVKMDGNEIYVTVKPTTKQDEDDNGESKNVKSFIQENQKELVDNLEPNDLLKIPEIESLFDEKDIAAIKSTVGRGSQAVQFLDLCDKLPNRGMAVVFPYLKERVPPSDKIHDSSELDTVRNWIEQHREPLLEEIDSRFIETTIQYMEDVPNEVKASWDGSKSRRQNAENFLRFILKRDDGVMALEKTWKENGSSFDEN